MKFSALLGNFVLVMALLMWPLNQVTSHEFRPLPSSIQDTIFAPDYQAKQLILRNTYLYPTVFMARLFQNKWLIPLNKFKSNFFTLLDPNYYFFASHPRELDGNQNSIRLPFVLLFFLLVGVFNFSTLSRSRLYGGLFLIFILSLSFLNHFSRYDLLLWPFFCLFTFHGFHSLSRQNSRLNQLLVFSLLLVTFMEYFRMYLRG